VATISLSYDDETVLAVLNRIARSFTPAGMRPVMKEIGEELAESPRVLGFSAQEVNLALVDALAWAHEMAQAPA
jgi:hypothetical protein